MLTKPDTTSAQKRRVFKIMLSAHEDIDLDEFLCKRAKNYSLKIVGGIKNYREVELTATNERLRSFIRNLPTTIAAAYEE